MWQLPSFGYKFCEKLLLKPKIFVHEQNAVLGRLNKLAARSVDQVGVAFPETKVPEHKKAYVGYPVRASAVQVMDKVLTP